MDGATISVIIAGLAGMITAVCTGIAQLRKVTLDHVNDNTERLVQTERRLRESDAEVERLRAWQVAVLRKVHHLRVAWAVADSAAVEAYLTEIDDMSRDLIA